MVTISKEHLDRLISIESHVHYGEPPPPAQLPFVAILRDSPVLLSAPHGARTFRHVADDEWHEEDEYTAGFALFLAELCGTPVVSTIWRTDDSDPNYHGEALSAYKRTVRNIVASNGVRWVLDLHGASQNTPKMDTKALVDLGTRGDLKSLPDPQRHQLQEVIEARLGKETVHHNGFPAKEVGRSVTAFCHGELKLHAVQIEMKPFVRVPQRRTDATLYSSEGPFGGDPDTIIGMLQSLADFIEYLKGCKD